MSKRMKSNFPMMVVAICLGLVGLVAIGVEAGDYHNSPLICSDCHVMHASTDNGGTLYNAGNGYVDLLKATNTATLCLNCHSALGPNAIVRPLVADNIGGETNSGGQFNWNRTAATSVFAAVSAPGNFIDSRSHNLYGSAAAQGDPPGDVTGAYDNGTRFLTCSSCHDQHGNSQYRNLVNDPNPGNADIIACTVTATYYARNWNDTAVWKDSGVMSVKSMTPFCQDCHQKFGPAAASAAGVITVGNTYDATNGLVDNSAGANSHHPVDFSMTGTTLGYYNAVPGGGGDTYPLVATTAGNNAVFCLTCHRAHGSRNNDNLRFASDSAAISGGPEGCQTCHNK